MRQTASFSLIILLVVALSGTVGTPKKAEALSGCCKERVNPNGPWIISKRALKDCQKLNKDNDNDYIFDETGLYWWDINC